MFKCENCGKQVEAKVRQSTIVTDKRVKEYPMSQSKGWEIVKEIKVCPVCSNLKED